MRQYATNETSSAITDAVVFTVVAQFGYQFVRASSRVDDTDGAVLA